MKIHIRVFRPNDFFKYHWFFDEISINKDPLSVLKNSDYIFENDTPIIKHHFPNAEQISVPNAGHWLHAENPTFFFEVVTSWLQKH